MSFHIPEYALYYDDEAEIRDQHWNPKAGDRVVDIGARYGSYTLPALAAGASVLAIDPHQGILDLLRAAAEANEFEVETLCAGLYDGTPYPHDLLLDVGEVCPSFDAVRWTTLDDVVDNGWVDWVKIDVEGAEFGVLNGGLDTLRECHPKLLIEDHTRVYEWARTNRIADRMHDLLRALGYKITSVPYTADTGSPRDFTIAV